MNPGDQVVIVDKGKSYKIEELGVFKPQIEKVKSLAAGEVGAVFCNIKDPQEVVVPDYIVSKNNPTEKPTPSGKKMPSMVFVEYFQEHLPIMVFCVMQ